MSIMVSGSFWQSMLSEAKATDDARQARMVSVFFMFFLNGYGGAGIDLCRAFYSLMGRL